VGAQTVDIWPGVAPGSEQWAHKELTVDDTPIGTVILNVVKPTLTAYLPEPSNANGTAVLIAPGGAFVALAMGQEGPVIARWFQERGVAAFVLKYRLLERIDGGPLPSNFDEAGKYGIADGIQALQVIRQRATEWRVNANRVGFVGFSAGAMVVSGALLQTDARARPDFAGVIYGAPFGVMPAIPKQLPPLFLAWAQDDEQALTFIVRFHDALRAAGHKPEVHAYSAGGHGFASKQQGTTSDNWLEHFQAWMRAQGF
jgi:acetyl esterase/lipase